MPGRATDELPPLSAEVREYVRVFAAEERPSPRARATSWEAIERRVGADRRRAGWWTAGAVLAIAAAVVLVAAGLRGDLTSRAPDESSMQTPWEGHAEESGGGTSKRGAPARETAGSVAAGSVEAVSAEEARSIEPEASLLGDDEDERSTASSGQSTAGSRGARRDRAHAEAEAEEAEETEAEEEEAETDAPSLAEELALVRRAKLALVEGRAVEALALLDDHRARFEAGALRREGTVLRAEALCALGRVDEAARVRDGFVRAHAGSPLVARMRSVCR